MRIALARNSLTTPPRKLQKSAGFKVDPSREEERKKRKEKKREGGVQRDDKSLVATCEYSRENETIEERRELERAL